MTYGLPQGSITDPMHFIQWLHTCSLRDGINIFIIHGIVNNLYLNLFYALRKYTFDDVLINKP